MNKNKIIIWVIALIVVLAFVGFLYYSIPHQKQVPIADILKNYDKYKDKTVMVEGTPVILSTIITRYGKFSFFAIKDNTGQIPVSRDIYESYINNKIGVVGEVGEVCVHGIANETSGTWACDRKEIGIVA